MFAYNTCLKTHSCHKHIVTFNFSSNTGRTNREALDDEDAEAEEAEAGADRDSRE